MLFFLQESYNNCMINVYRSVFLKDGPGNMTGKQKDKLMSSCQKIIHLKNPCIKKIQFAACRLLQLPDVFYSGAASNLSLCLTEEEILDKSPKLMRLRSLQDDLIAHQCRFAP